VTGNLELLTSLNKKFLSAHTKASDMGKRIKYYKMEYENEKRQ